MIFGNGCWLQKEGYECFAPQQAYFVAKAENKVTICAPTGRIHHRGDTLGGINLTLEITSPMPEVIRVKTSHHLGVRNHGPEFELEKTEMLPLEVEEDEAAIRISSGSLSLVITKDNWNMSYERDGEILTASCGRDLAYMKTDWKGHAYDNGRGEAYMRQQLGLGVGEVVYGMGERYTSFVKNGQSIDIWNEDGGTSTYQSYKNIPFYLTSKGYGVFVNHPEHVSFEVGTEQVSKVEFSVKGESLDYFLLNGPAMKNVLERYTTLTGKPALPPQWTFGLWLSTSFTTNYDEETVMSFVNGMEERGIPLQVFHFDCFWMKEFHWSDFIWDSRVFPDPKGMLQRIKAKGLKICVWINPYIAQESCLFQEGMDNEYLVLKENQDVWQWDMWQPGMALVDFTNPDACVWFQEKLEVLLDMGVDCFKTDFGERIPVDHICYFDGSSPEKMHNYYTYLYNKVVYELLERKKGKGEAVLFARSATVGGQKFPVHWGGDCWSTYEAMAESLRGGLSLTMSGFGYWSHDIGGFENTSTADVYKRWAAFGLLSSHSRFHGSTSYRVPWAYDDEAVDVVRFFTKLKLEILPYLYSSAVITSVTGIPVMRSMVLEFQDDPVCLNLDRQYMLGERLLVAPIFNDKGEASYYLPDGMWTNYFTGEVRQGGRFQKEQHDYFSIPLWVRENSIVPVQEGAERASDSFGDKLLLKVYGLGEEAKAIVYENAEEALRVTIRRKDGKIVITSRGDKSYRIQFVNEKLHTVTGGKLKMENEDSIIMAENPKGEIICQ